jgi:cyanophycinase
VYCLLGAAVNGSFAQSPAGSLIIVGGGTIPDSIRARFVELAGGNTGRLVVIPTASERPDAGDVSQATEPWKNFGFASIHVLHTRRRVEADDPAFIQPLKSATAVWFGGGQQTRLTEAYADTAVHRELSALLKRGGVIGGTSAGAAVMSKPMISGGTDTPQMAEGFGLLPHDLLIDQHFLKRSRMNRLLEAMRLKPGIIGVGIDESTALWVRDGKATVIGESYVAWIEPAAPTVRIKFLKAGDSIPVPALPLQ